MGTNQSGLRSEGGLVRMGTKEERERRWRSRARWWSALGSALGMCCGVNHFQMTSQRFREVR